MSKKFREQAEKKVYKLLQTIVDPELGVNVVDMGFVYGIKLKTQNSKLKTIKITMTLTTPGCPLGSWFVGEIREIVSRGMDMDEDGVVVEMVFDPPWTQEMMSEEAKAELGWD